MPSEYCSDCWAWTNWANVMDRSGNSERHCRDCDAPQVREQTQFWLEPEIFSQPAFTKFACFLARPHLLDVGNVICNLEQTRELTLLVMPNYQMRAGNWKIVAKQEISEPSFVRSTEFRGIFSWDFGDRRKVLYTQRRAAHAAMRARKEALGAGTPIVPEVAHSPTHSVSDALIKVVNEWDHTDLDDLEALKSLGDIIDEYARPFLKGTK